MNKQLDNIESDSRENSPYKLPSRETDHSVASAAF